MRFWTSKGSRQRIAGENSIVSGIVMMTSDGDVWFVINMNDLDF